MKIRMALFGLITLGFWMPMTTYAHAHLASSDPAANAVVREMPTQVLLHFTESLEVPLSKVVVKRDVDSKVLNKGELIPVKNDSKSIAVPLVPGSSQESQVSVEWKVVSKDGHRMNGTYHFSFNSEKKN